MYSRNHFSDDENSDEDINIFPFGEELIDSQILQSMDDEKLQKACRLDKRINKLCNNEEFWRQRLAKRLGYDVDLRKFGNKYKQAYINLIRNSSPFGQIGELAARAAKYGYLEIVANTLNSYVANAYIDRDIRPFGTTISHFVDIVRDTYGTAISGGSTEVMSYIESKYKVTAKDLSTMAYDFAFCKGVNIKSIKYLIDKYGEVLTYIFLL